MVSLPWLVLYGLGTTIGAGIYALTGVVAGRAGMQTPACFLFASFLALFTALSFAELASRFPRAGGEAVYVQEGFGWSWLSTLVGALVVLAGLVSAATVSVAFVGYLGDLVPVPRVPAVGVVVLVLGSVAAWGVKESVTLAGLVTLVEVGGLLLIAGLGAGHLAALPERAIEMVPLDPTAWRAVASAAMLAFYAFLGFEDMVNVAEEVREVRRVMPRAIVITLVVTALLYALLSSVAVLAVPPAELAASAAPLALVFDRVGGPAPLLGLIALFALVNGALVQLIKASRVLFGLAGRGAVPAFFGRVHPRTRTPLVATVLVTAAAGLLAATLPLAALAETTSLITLGTFALANLALVLVKLRHEPPEGATVYPLAVPLVGFALSAAFVGLEIANRLPGS
ncbi:MAG: APC family permease [Myxococcota bacterium]|nr:APC family permease [Myxococcota bacterium]